MTQNQKRSPTRGGIRVGAGRPKGSRDSKPREKQLPKKSYTIRLHSFLTDEIRAKAAIAGLSVTRYLESLLDAILDKR